MAPETRLPWQVRAVLRRLMMGCRRALSRATDHCGMGQFLPVEPLPLAAVDPALIRLIVSCLLSLEYQAHPIVCRPTRGPVQAPSLQLSLPRFPDLLEPADPDSTRSFRA